MKTAVVCKHHIGELLAVIHEKTLPLDISTLQEPTVDDLCVFQNEIERLIPEVRQHERPFYSITWEEGL